MTTKTKPSPTLANRPRTTTIGQPLLGAFEAPVGHVAHDPDQPRRDWESVQASAALRDLADSVRQYGVLQPILVRESPQRGSPEPHYIIISGARRREAAAMAGLPTVPVVVRDAEGAQIRVLQLTENLLRHDLLPLEEARAFKELMELKGHSAEELGRILHLNGQTIRNRLRILQDDVLANAVQSGQISATAAKIIAQMPPEQCEEFKQRIKSGEHLFTPGVIRARQQRLRAGLTHPRDKRPLRSDPPVVVDPVASLPANSTLAGNPARDVQNSSEKDPAQPRPSLLPSPTDSTIDAPHLQANQDATLTTDNQQSGRPAVASQETQSGLTWTAAQTERTDSLAATLAPVLSHGLGERDLHAVITALKDMLTSPHAEPWSKALLSAVLVRVEQG